MVPTTRIQKLNEAEVNPQGEYVLYWMTFFRRLSYNSSLDRAITWSNELKKPLIILEPLRANYPWANDRIHQFVLEGMVLHQRELKDKPVTYYPYVETKIDAAQGLLQALAHKAAVVVTDAYPAFFIPGMLNKAASIVSVHFEAVDSNGILPLQANDKLYETAYSFRRFLQYDLPRHFISRPSKNPFGALLANQEAPIARSIIQKYAQADVEKLLTQRGLSALPIDHTIKPILGIAGGTLNARKHLDSFLDDKVQLYLTDRNKVSRDCTSRLSPYLHFGHISAHEIFERLMDLEEWSPDQISEKCDGRRSGWWGVNKSFEAFLDQLITWRELGFNRVLLQKNFDRYETLPPWAKQTLEKHSSDPRPYQYSLEQFESAQTHDELWNAAQNQLINEGIIHNYLRMLWGKKILEWSSSPKEALKIMIELNNKYALDGRDPNSYSGIFWVLGRFDRPWGPERPIYGTIRYMSSDSTRKKMRVDSYIEEHAT